LNDLNTATENTAVTDDQLEAILADSELVVAILSQHGPRHTVGSLTLALAVSYVAVGFSKEQALESAAAGLGAAYDMAHQASEEAKASMN
jgi:hypothetical protein